MIKESAKFENSSIFEGMTSIRAIIKSIDTCVSDRRIQKILFSKDKLRKISKEVGYLRAVSEKYGFEIVESCDEEIDKIAVGSSHGGLIAYGSERTIPYITSSLISEGGFYVLLEGIEDPYNFGYAIRSLYPAGCDGIILQERNWLSAAGVVARSSAGASELLPAFRISSPSDLDLFKEKGYKIVCAEEKTDNVLGKTELKRPLVLIIGGEKRGISKPYLEKSDLKIKIDYQREFSASLSAASATTMFAYEVMRQNSK